MDDNGDDAVLNTTKMKTTMLTITMITTIATMYTMTTSRMMM